MQHSRSLESKPWRRHDVQGQLRAWQEVLRGWAYTLTLELMKVFLEEVAECGSQEQAVKERNTIVPGGRNCAVEDRGAKVPTNPLKGVNS